MIRTQPSRGRSRISHGLGVPLLLSLSVVAGAIAAQPASELSLGEVTTMTVTGDQPTVLSFDAATAAFLTVIVRGSGDADLSVAITDDLGQVVPEGRVDRDLGGNMGAEQITVTLSHPAEYHVRVVSRSERSEFKMAATWVPFPDAQMEPGPDGRPTAATSLAPGTRIESSLDPSVGDHWDWYGVDTGPDSVVTVLTDAPEGDLVLESFAESDFGQPTDRSDQDMGGVSGNESLTIPNPTGGTVYLRVSNLRTSGGAVPYTIRAGVM